VKATRKGQRGRQGQERWRREATGRRREQGRQGEEMREGTGEMGVRGWQVRKGRPVWEEGGQTRLEEMID
jgi:hypothetical protein